MFSMFGGGGKDDKPSDDKPEPPPKEARAEKTRAEKNVHGFDPRALERAAKAAKELDQSKNSGAALKVIEKQELTKQEEAKAERAKYQAMQQELAIRKVQEEEESARRTLDRQAELERQRANYSDELERKRMVEQINAQRHLADEERKKSEESLRRQEEIRRKTLEYEAELRQQTEIARARAEAEGRILQERENHDLELEKRRKDSENLRETYMQSIKLITTNVGEGLKDFITDEGKLKNFAITTTAIAFGIYTTKTGVGVIGRYIESRMGKPSLVRETTRSSPFTAIRHPIVTLKSAWSRFGTSAGETAMKDVILESDISQRLTRVAISTSNTTKNKAPYRHLLLHGPPGTGKTMFAKGLARQSGLHYAIMTGGDVAPLGKDAVTEIHKLFDWANATNKGVLLFVDEADAFLRKRSTEKISEDMRNALNAFLYRTGEASQKFMVVYASNQPEQFDWAINDRIDEMVEFRLPGETERLKMIILYMEKYILNPAKGLPIKVEGIDESVLTTVSKMTQGYSGREISKLAIAWQAAAYGTVDRLLNKELLFEVLENSKSSKAQKLTWLSAEEIENLTKDKPKK